MRSHFMASLLLCGLTTATAQAQVAQLAKVPRQGYLAPSSYGCGVRHGYGANCGVAGSYAVNCGGCGECDSIGGYFGRNIHPVDPCVCDGSVCLDMIHGIKCLLDTTVSGVVGTVFGGLHAVSCHASGSLAALHCAAMFGCHSCGGSYCGGCDGTGYGAVMDSGSYLSTPDETLPIGPEPIEVPEDLEDPFVDDPDSTSAVPQTRRIRRPGPADYWWANPYTRVRPADYQRAVRRTARSRYLLGRPLTVRR